MAHRGLALTQPLAQVGDVKLAVGRQCEIKQDAQAGFIAQKLENLSKFANGLIRHFGRRRGGLAIGVGSAFGFFSCHGTETSSFLAKTERYRRRAGLIHSVFANNRMLDKPPRPEIPGSGRREDGRRAGHPRLFKLATESAAGNGLGNLHFMLPNMNSAKSFGYNPVATPVKVACYLNSYEFSRKNTARSEGSDTSFSK